MISIQDAGEFLSHQLKFNNWKDVLQQDKLTFLRLLVPHYAHNIYFQVKVPKISIIEINDEIQFILKNISMSAVTEEERKFPDVEDIIKAGLNGEGGNCIFQNGFLMVLLKSLGFDAFIVAGTFQGEGYLPNNHVLCIVRLNAEELYLLDLGVTLPFAEPVPLHNLPYVNQAVGCRYKYRKSENGLYERTQLDGALFGGEYVCFVLYFEKFNPLIGLK